MLRIVGLSHPLKALSHSGATMRQLDTPEISVAFLGGTGMEGLKTSWKHLIADKRHFLSKHKGTMPYKERYSRFSLCKIK